MLKRKQTWYLNDAELNGINEPLEGRNVSASVHF